MRLLLLRVGKNRRGQFFLLDRWPNQKLQQTAHAKGGFSVHTAAPA